MLALMYDYGQGVPIHGGILLNHTRLNQILTLTPEFVRVQTGKRIRALGGAAPNMLDISRRGRDPQST